MMNAWVSIDRVVKSLEKAKAKNSGAVLLIGAGCSVTAGIPDAAEFENLIKTTCPETYANAKDKSFHGLLNILNQKELDSIVYHRLRNSKINWAHIASALLMQNGYVDWIVTTNFDRLTERACSLIGEHPAIYDCALSKPLPGSVPAKKSIFHIRGQHPAAPPVTGEDSSEALEQWMDLLLDCASSERPWIVVGFDGQNDPVFDRLQKTKQFKQGLFWVLHEKPTPAKHVVDGLMLKQNSAFYTEGPDADSFLLNLTQITKIFPPAFITAPLEHLDLQFSEIADFPIVGQKASIDVTGIFRQQINLMMDRVKTETINSSEGKKVNLHAKILDAQRLLLSGELDQVLKFKELHHKTKSLELAELLYWACVLKGTELTEKIKSGDGQNTKILLENAENLFTEANELCPDKTEALYNWGVILNEMARGAEGDPAVKYYSRAGGKFQRTIQTDKSYTEAYFAWGETLLERGLLVKGEETFSLLSQAIEKFQATLAREPNHLNALCSCGRALVYLARHQSSNQTSAILARATDILHSAVILNPHHPQALTLLGQVLTLKGELGLEGDTEKLWSQAQEKFKLGVQIKPDNYQAYCSWGTLLWLWATKIPHDRAESLYKQAAEKFQTSLSLYHKLPEAYAGWGNVLFSLGLLKTGDDASYFFGQSLDKFRSALAIDRDNTDVLNTWGKALLKLANFMEGTEAEAVYTQAEEKFQAVLAIRPNHHEALNNWGNVLMRLAGIRKGSGKYLLAEAIDKYRAALAIEPSNVEVLNSWGDILFQVARAKKGEESEKLFQQAEEKYQAALAQNPSYPGSFFNWGWILMEKAKLQKGKDREKSLTKSAENFEAALKLKPNMAKAQLYWGTCLLELSKLKKGINAHPLLASAQKKFMLAEELVPGSSAYHIARLMALLGNESGCRDWLGKCTELNILPAEDVLLSENDFTLVLNSKWFKQLTESDTAKTPTPGNPDK